MEILIIFSTAIAAFLITFLSIPSIIKVAQEKHLFDSPDDDRKAHKHKTPTLGGVAIFGGISISIAFFVDASRLPELIYAFSAIILLFFTGVKDDIIPLSPSKKLIAQLIASSILVLKCDIRFTSLYGLFGVDEITYWVSVPISIFTMLVIINSFNLIDGINGLAGGVSLLVSLIFGYLFWMSNQYEMVIIAISLSGALLGFLCYNFGKNAQIFMGDTGALTLGLFLGWFCIAFIETNRLNANHFKPSFAPVFAFAILIIPLFDTLRVFVIRIYHGKSPFSGDRNHLHHLLVDGGFSHIGACLILYCANLTFVGLALLFKDVPQLFLLMGILGLASISSGLLFQWKNKQILVRNKKAETSIASAPQILESELK